MPYFTGMKERKKQIDKTLAEGTTSSIRTGQPKIKAKKKSKAEELKAWYDEMGIIPPEAK